MQVLTGMTMQNFAEFWDIGDLSLMISTYIVAPNWFVVSRYSHES